MLPLCLDCGDLNGGPRFLSPPNIGSTLCAQANGLGSVSSTTLCLCAVCLHTHTCGTEATSLLMPAVN
jgi:hypothetical protein